MSSGCPTTDRSSTTTGMELCEDLYYVSKDSLSEASKLVAECKGDLETCEAIKAKFDANFAKVLLNPEADDGEQEIDPEQYMVSPIDLGGQKVLDYVQKNMPAEIKKEQEQQREEVLAQIKSQINEEEDEDVKEMLEARLESMQKSPGVEVLELVGQIGPLKTIKAVVLARECFLEALEEEKKKLEKEGVTGDALKERMDEFPQEISLREWMEVLNANAEEEDDDLDSLNSEEMAAIQAELETEEGEEDGGGAEEPPTKKAKTE